jgi:hypothetical protein
MCAGAGTPVFLLDLHIISMIVDHITANNSKGFTRYLNDTKRFDVLSEGPSSGISSHFA